MGTPQFINILDSEIKIETETPPIKNRNSKRNILIQDSKYNTLIQDPDFKIQNLCNNSDSFEVTSWDWVFWVESK